MGGARRGERGRRPARSRSTAWLRVGCLLALSFALQGASGGGCAPSIGFESVRTAQLQASAATVDYLFTSPALGNNASIRASFQLRDAVPADMGTYTLTITNNTTSTLVGVFGPNTPGEPLLVQDVSFAPSSTFGIRVTEAGGPAPRSFELAMGPRYTLPATALALGSTTPNLTLASGEYETLSITVGAGQGGPTDLYFDDVNVSLQNNVVKLIGPSRIPIVTSATGKNDLSFDASELPALDLAEGTYLAVITSEGTGTYSMQAGPYAGQIPPDDVDGPCEDVTAPGFGTPTELTGLFLSPVGDRDCFRFSLPFGISALRVGLDEGSAAPGQNEVRVVQDGLFVGNRTASGDLNGTIDVEGGIASTYEVTVNNLENGTFGYDLTLEIDGPCSGVGCVVAPGVTTEVSFAGGSVIEVDVRDDLASPAALATDAVASFQLDKLSTGTFRLEILGDTDGDTNLEVLCSGEDNADFFLENCDLGTVDGLPVARVTRVSGSGQTAAVRMGPDLRALAAAPTPIVPSGDATYVGPLATSLDGFGDEAFASFTLASPAQVGIGAALGIGKGASRVQVCAASELAVALIDPLHVCALETPYDGTELDADAETLAAGDYVVLVDNDGLGTGSVDVCVGPGPVASDEDGTVIALPNLTPTSPAVPASGQLLCGDTDRLELTTAADQLVDLVVEESPAGATGALEVEVLVEDSNNPGVYVPVASKSGASKVTFRNLALQAADAYRIVIDNGSIGQTAYHLTLSDPDA